MAVVSRVATIKYSATVGGDAVGFRQWQATADTQDTAAGSSVVVTIVLTSGAAAPAVTDTLTLEYRNDSGGVIKSVTLNNTTTPQTDTFFFTDTGSIGINNRCGTVEIVLHAVKTTGDPTNTYDTETDGSPNTPPTGFTTVTLDRGWIRGTTTLIEDVSNVSLGGGETEPAQYDESLFVRTTSGAVSYVARALTVASSAGSLSSSTNSSTSVTRDVTFSNVVDNRFPAASTVVGWTITVPNASLTGSPDWTYTSTTDDSITVDPRLSCTHLFQINSDTFSTPPMANNEPTKRRIFPDVASLSTNLMASRGSLVGNVTTEGKNSITYTMTMDPQGPGSIVTYSGRVTATQGGETGWGPLDEWSQFPAGNWDKTITITAPSDITGASYLLNNTDTYAFVASNPALSPQTAANSTQIGRHLIIGDKLGVVFWVYDEEALKLVAVDSPVVTIQRVTAGKLQYLDSTETAFIDLVGAATAHQFPMTETIAGTSRLYSKVFQTSSPLWTARDVQTLCSGEVEGSPYFAAITAEIVDKFFSHDDSTGLASSPPGTGTGGGMTRLITINALEKEKRRKRLQDFLNKAISEDRFDTLLSSLESKFNNEDKKLEINDDEEALLHILMMINEDENL